jgi:hypothetical protein
MPTTTSRASPDELRAQFRRATRMPQLLEVRERCRIVLRQVSDAMDDGDNGDSDADRVVHAVEVAGQ